MNYITDFKGEIRNNPGNNGSTGKRTENYESETGRMAYAFSTLHFNQNLIQFAETKANTLLLINSIFLATVTTMMERGLGQDLIGNVFQIVKILFFITSAISVITCLMVVIPKSDDPSENKRRDMIFYMDILQYNSINNYTYEFHRTKASTLREDILKRCYMISKIASSKYNRYRMSQNMTFLSCTFWLLTTCLYYFH